jgi:hypothetical protein
VWGSKYVYAVSRKPIPMNEMSVAGDAILSPVTLNRFLTYNEPERRRASWRESLKCHRELIEAAQRTCVTWRLAFDGGGVPAEAFIQKNSSCVLSL